MSHGDVVIDSRPDPRTVPFTDERDVIAALTAWERDGLEILQRCRVAPDRQQYLTETLTEFCRIAYVEWCIYQGIEPREWR